ncbi:hypothetical protein [Sandaracinus amylolyticus]|uniref:Putative serine/threonine-protein kinase pkwA n=1 Tax=Sandaracinus amylolyticus TaxID=927083 RepID=A0A0F6YHS0_9BACT|nr:hypothetical protein [Sandaracinus amylolyticus]AKF05026.1 Putative serine/threonine-protein kinase pkwA [Sandaracinus amylolyticus]
MRALAAALVVVTFVLVPALALAKGPTLPPNESVWQGRYVCAQGVTGLTLTVRPVGADRVSATFSFYAVPENPDVPSGSYTMTGLLSATSEVVQLVPERWVQQPRGYVMVAMSGTFDVAQGVMRGRVDGPGCTEFQLRRMR